MKKIIFGVMIAVVLMSVMSVTALAQTHEWWLVPVEASCGVDGNGHKVCTDFDLVYYDTTTDTAWNTDGYMVFVEYGGPVGNSVAAFTIEPVDSGNAVPDMGSADLGQGTGGMMFSTGAIVGSGNFNDGSTFATMTLTNPGTVAWNWNAFGGGNFAVLDPAGNLIYGDGPAGLEALGQLYPPDIDDDGIGDPAPPIPEIITIALIALGLIALGGYVWYRRRNHQAVMAA